MRQFFLPPGSGGFFLTQVHLGHNSVEERSRTGGLQLWLQLLPRTAPRMAGKLPAGTAEAVYNIRVINSPSFNLRTGDYDCFGLEQEH